MLPLVYGGIITIVTLSLQRCVHYYHYIKERFDLKFKQLITGTLAMTLVTTSVFAAGEYPYDHMEAREGVTYEVQGTETPIDTPRGAAAGGWVDLGPFERRIFDNIVDQMYYDQFGDGFEFLQRNSQDINRVATYGNLRMEVLSSIAIGGGLQYSYDFNRETQEFTRSDEPAYRLVEVYTFFSLIDTSGAVEFSERMAMGMRPEEPPADDFYRRWVSAGGARFLFQDEETGAGIFSVHHSGFQGADATDVNINVTLESIMSDLTMIDELIDLDISALVEAHEATTIMIAGEDLRGWGTSLSREEVGEDFSPSEINHEVLTRDELNIPLTEGIYLSNIALIGNALHVQFNEYTDGMFHGGPSERWVNVFVTDINRADSENPWEAHISADIFLDVSLADSDFNLINNRRHTEHVFRLENLDDLSNFSFSLMGSYFRNVMRVNLGVDSLVLPINTQVIALDDVIEVLTSEASGGQMVTISDIVITPMGVSYSIINAEHLWTMANRADDLWFHPMDSITIMLTYSDGTQVVYEGMGGSFGLGGTYPNFDTMHVAITGVAIDLDNLVSISFGATVVNL